MPNLKTYPYDPHLAAMWQQGKVGSQLVHHDTYDFDDDPVGGTLAEVVDDIVEGLPDELRDTMYWVAIAGLGFNEAGREMGVHGTTVSRRFARAVAEVRDALVSHPAAALLTHRLPAGEGTEPPGLDAGFADAFAALLRAAA